VEGAEIDDVLLQQGNARPHTCAATSDAIARFVFTVLPYPAYSPDLAASDFYLLPKLKEDLRGQNLSSDKEGKAAVRQSFREKEKYFFRTEFKNLLNVGYGVLKLEEIMWKNGYAEL
jgi:hypothetical protein